MAKKQSTDQRQRNKAARRRGKWFAAISAKCTGYRTVLPPARGTNRDARFVSALHGWQQVVRWTPEHVSV